MFSELYSITAGENTSLETADIAFSTPVLFKRKIYSENRKLIRRLLSSWHDGIRFCLEGNLVDWYRENNLDDLADFTEKTMNRVWQMTDDRDIIFFTVMYSIASHIKNLYWSGFTFNSLLEYGISLVVCYRKNPKDLTAMKILQSAQIMVENGLLRLYLKHSAEEKADLYLSALKKVEEKIVQKRDDCGNIALILGQALIESGVSRQACTDQESIVTPRGLLSFLKRNREIPEILEDKLKSNPEILDDDDVFSFLIRYSSPKSSCTFVWNNSSIPTLRIFGCKLLELCEKAEKDDQSVKISEKSCRMIESAQTLIEYGLIRFYLDSTDYNVRKMYLPAVERVEKALAQGQTDSLSAARILGNALKRVRDFGLPQKEGTAAAAPKLKISGSELTDIKKQKTRIRNSYVSLPAMPDVVKEIQFKSPRHVIDFLRETEAVDALVYNDFIVNNYSKLQSIKKTCINNWLYQEFNSVFPQKKHCITLENKKEVTGIFKTSNHILRYIKYLFSKGEFYFLYKFYADNRTYLETQCMFNEKEKNELFIKYREQMKKIILIDNIAYRDADECIEYYRDLKRLNSDEAENFMIKCLAQVKGNDNIHGILDFPEELKTSSSEFKN